MRILCGYYEDIMRILCGYYADIMRILCGYYADIMRILCGYYADIMRILCGYYEDIMRILYIELEYYQVLTKLIFDLSEVKFSFNYFISLIIVILRINIIYYLKSYLILD